MMPLAPQLSIPYFDQLSTLTKIRNQGEMKASKPKLSFSIDSIVGKRKTFETSPTINDRSNDNDGASQDDASNDQEPLERSLKKRSRESLDGQTQSLMIDRRDSSSPQSSLDTNRRSISPLSNGLLFNDNISSQPNQHHHTETGSSPARSLSPLSLVINNSNTRNIQPNVSQFVATATNKQPQQLAGQSTTANSSSHSPLSSTPPAPATSRQCSTPTSGQIPQVSTMGHPNHPMMVAAAAAAAAASSAAAAHQFPSLPNDYQQHAAAFYPWFLRANPFAGRFPGMPFDTPLGSFLLPPFRKPKRIRTAFSPGQLLKLEQAFEKNHYVVGNERKQLANHLGLSETQVKVWFQNRRTKHKRQKQEDEESGSGSVTNGDNNSNNANNKDYSDEDDEEIDLEDEDCQSDEQDQDDGTNNNNNSDINNSNHHNAAALKFANMHHLWYQSAMSAGLMGDHPPVTSSGSN